MNDIRPKVIGINPRCRVNQLRYGFSLLETILVLAILAALVAIVWPALRKPLNQSRVQDAAQQLRQELMNARFDAIESGLPIYFQYRSSSSEYLIAPLKPPDPNANRSIATVETEPLETLGRQTVDDIGPDVKTLPGDCQFARLTKGVTTPDPTVPTSSESLSLAPRIDPADTIDWSSPITFYPSGRMTSGQLMLQSDDGYQVQLEIQGFSGLIRINKLRRANSP